MIAKVAMKIPAQRRPAFLVMLRSFAARRWGLLGPLISVAASSVLLAFSLAGLWGAWLSEWRAPLAVFVASVALAQIWLVLRRIASAESYTFHQLEMQGATQTSLSSAAGALGGIFAVLASLPTLPVLLAVRNPLADIAGLSPEASGPSAEHLVVLLFLTSLVLVALVAALAGAVPLPCQHHRVSARAVWGTALALLGLEAITAGSRRWFAFASETFSLGTALLVLGLVLAAPAAYVLPAQLLSRLTRRKQGGTGAASPWSASPALGEAAAAMALALALNTWVLAGPHAEGTSTAIAWKTAFFFTLGYALAVTFWAVWPLTRGGEQSYGRLWALGAGTPAILRLALRQSLPVALFQSAGGTALGVGLAFALRNYSVPGQQTGTPLADLWPQVACLAGVAFVACVVVWVLAALSARFEPGQ